MNAQTQTAPHSQRSFRVFLVVFTALAGLLNQPLVAADESAIGQKAQEVAQATSNAVEKAEAAAAGTAKDLWQRIDAARIKNRTPDQIVSWVITGALVGAIAGMMTSLKPTGLGRLGRLGLGLVGAFIGGIVVQVQNIDFGWGPVLIRYEELLFSLLGAIVIVLLPKIIGWRLKKKVLTR